jgi:dCMP deaminase
VKNKRILCTGYVGSPPGMLHCDEVGHLLRKVKDEKGIIRQHCMRTTHAEQNALIQSARFGIAVEGGTLYCTMEPCSACAMLIVGAGITKVVCEKRYHASDDTREIFAKCNVELKVMKNEIEEYDNM